MGDALKSQKKGLKMDVTRMGYLTQKLKEIVCRGNCGSKMREVVYGGNYLRNGPVG